MNNTHHMLSEIESFFLSSGFVKFREEIRSNSSNCIGYRLGSEKIVIHSKLNGYFWIFLPNNQYTEILEEGKQGRCFSMPATLEKRINVKDEDSFHKLFDILKKIYN